MSRRVKRKPLAIDFQKSTEWAISFLSSTGAGHKKVGGGAIAVFDLFNRETYRAHAMTIMAAGKSSGFPAELSFMDSGYVWFKTKKPSNFADFHHRRAKIVIKDRLVKSWREVTIYEDVQGASELMKVKVNNYNATLWHKFSGDGISEIYYSNGSPVGNPDYEVHIDIPTEEDIPVDFEVTQQDFGIVIRMSGDLLFLFDEPKENQMVDWKFDYEASETLSRMMRYLNSLKTKYKRLRVEGHTDSKEKTPGYNMVLSKRRAQAVIDYFKKYKWALDHEITIDKPVGLGATKPVAPNQINGKDNEAGRAKNRRVELYLYKS